MPPNSPPKLLVEDLPIASLVPSKTNARTHSQRQISQIAASIRKFGFNNPILIDRENVVRAGHGRLGAARQCGMATVPVIRLEHMTPNDFRAYALADNRLAEEAGWDHEVLAIELQELQMLEPDLDLTLTGFEVGEIDLIIQNHGASKPAPEENIEPDISGPPVAQIGDCWLLGNHRIYCGSALEPVTYRGLMMGETADAVFTDPPLARFIFRAPPAD